MVPGLKWSVIQAGLILPVGLSAAAAPEGAGVNLVTNGDAEIGSMDGWSPTDLVEVIESAAPGDVGVPVGVSIGRFSFTGRLGPEFEACSQTIDLSAHAAAIDAGLLTCTVSGLLQSRTVAGIFDTVECAFEFQDGGGVPLQTLTFVDPSIVPGVFDWHPFSDELVVPAGTRSAQVTLTMQRTGGASTDAFADNISLVLHDASCPTDLDRDGLTGITDLLDLLAQWGTDPGGPPDFDGDGNIGITDLLDLLAAWGTCP